MDPVIDEAQVRRIARLARLELSDKDNRRYGGQLVHILDCVRQIVSSDTEGVEPHGHPLPVTNVLRADYPREGLASAAALAHAPATEQGRFLRVR